MSIRTDIVLPFANGRYLFKLPIRRIREVETLAGPIDLVRHRLLHGGYSIDDVIGVLQQGLIGGGKGWVNGTEVEVTTLRAESLIDNYVEGGALAEHHVTARQVIAALFVGYEPEDGQKKSGVTTDEPSPDASTGASSSTTAEPSD